MLRDAPSAVSAPPPSPVTTPEETAPSQPRSDRRPLDAAPWYRRIDPVEGRADRGRAAVHDRLPDLAAAHGRPGRPHLPRRPVRRGGLHDLERPVVRRPPHAGLQRAVAAARLAARARRWRWRSSARGLRGAVPAARARLVRRRARPLGLDLVRRRHRHAALHQPAPFAIGVAFGLAALLALQRRHYWLAILFAVLCPLGSPVAGLFLAMAGVAYAIAERNDRPKRSEGLAIAAAAFLPPVFLSWAFPEGGWAPFPTTAYIPIPLFALACLIVLPREQSALRWGAVLYGLGATLALALETPMGGNAVRLGALFGGPVLLCALWGRPWTKRWWACAGPHRRLRGARALAMVARRARRDQVHRGPGRQVRTTSSRSGSSCSGCPTSAASRSRSRARTGRAPRWRWTRRWRAAGCASWTRGSTRSSTGTAQPAHLRELAGRQRRALRRAAEREAGQELLRRAGADREGPALPAPALEVGRLARLRGAAAGAARDLAEGGRGSSSSSSSPTSCSWT